MSMIGLIALCHEDGPWDASDDELKHVLWADGSLVMAL